jgi:opacity protein-like surface antigen
MRLPLLAVLALLAAPAAAAGQTLEDYDYENLEFRGVGAEVGYILPTRIEPTVSFGIRADLGYLGPSVRIVPRASFWSSRLREGEVEELRENLLGLCQPPGSGCLRDLGEIRVSDLALGVDAHYTFAQEGVLPYAGAGVALHLLNGRGEAINGTFVEDLLDAIAPGVDLLGGVELPFGSALRLVAEARATLSSDVQYAGVSVGGSWRFPSPPVRGATAGGAR